MKFPFMYHPLQIALLQILFVIPASYRLFLYGLSSTHDGLTHLWRIARMHDSIQGQMLYPRWIPEMLLGYGYPVLNYYASATYYLVEILSRMGLDLLRGYIAAHVLLVWLAGVGMYLLARDTYHRQSTWTATVATVAYMYAPYLMINVYVRSAIAEIGAQALLPWLFWSFQRIWRADNPKHYVIIGTLILAALAVTHTISLLIVPPLLIAFTLALSISSQQRKSRFAYTLAAMISAMGISCFFWAPLMFEREYVAYTAFAVARQLMLPFNFLNSGQVIDPNFVYGFSNNAPWSLGLVQVTAAIVGLLALIWQIKSIATRDATAKNIWLFWVGIGLFCILFMLEVTKPIWFSNDILPIIQFPWRLLAILQIPLALLTGLIVTLLRPRLVQAVGALALMALLIFVHLPRLDWEFRFDSRTAQFNLGVNVYYDAIRGTIIEGHRDDLANQEFRPQWSEIAIRLDPDSLEQDRLARDNNLDHSVNLLAASPYHLQLETDSVNDFPLRVASYYFPGWSVTLDGQEKLEPYPTTNLGLLTVNLPAGKHRVDIKWSGTSAHFWSGLVSQLTLAILFFLILWFRHLRGWIVVIMPALTFALVATYLQPPLAPIQKVELPTSPPGLEFLGYDAPILHEDGVSLSTYWFVRQTEPSGIRTRWQMISESGEVVQESIAKPYYNGYSSTEWASNTVVDDGYWLPLPPGIAPGIYHIHMTLLDEESDNVYYAQEIGTVAVKRAIEQFQPSYPLDVHFNQTVKLTGYDRGVVEPSLQRYKALPTRPEIPVVYTGQTLAYTLYWRTEVQAKDPYVGFLHLLDLQDIPHVQRDQNPGPLLQPSAIWTPYGTYPDSYQMPITQTVPSGIYITDVGMYDWRYENRFDVTIPGVDGVFDHYELPPIKVVNSTVRPKGAKVDVHFAEFAQLINFQVESRRAGLQAVEAGSRLEIQPGDTITLTTYYKAIQPTTATLTRFVQIRNAQNQILTQYDSEPQEGRNPSWAWLPDETIIDVTTLMLPSNVPDEPYTLYLGWYDAAADLTHIATFDQHGNRLINDEYPLLQVTVEQ